VLSIAADDEADEHPRIKDRITLVPESEVPYDVMDRSTWLLSWCGGGSGGLGASQPGASPLFKGVSL
jgi:hypothetical protein